MNFLFYYRGLKKYVIKAVALVAASLFIISCSKNDTETWPVPESLDGLWVESQGVLSSSGTKLMNLEVKGLDVLCCYSLETVEKSVSEKQLSAKMTYNKENGEGSVTFPNDEEVGFTFRIGENGNMYTSNNKCLVRYSRALSSLIPSPGLQDEKLDSDYVGLTSHNELSRAVIPVPVTPASYAIQFLQWLGPIVARSAATYGCNAIYKELFESPESKKLDEIFASVEQINSALTELTELTELYHNTTYENYLNKRLNDYVAPLINYTSEYYTRIKNCDGSEEAIKELVVEWGDGMIGGNKAVTQWQNFVTFLTGSVVEQKDLYTIYDIYVYNTTPWESQGYDFREWIRNTDMAVIAQNAFLATLYYRVKDGYDAQSRDSFIAKAASTVEAYKAYSQKNVVERHDSLAICQIKGAHFAMRKELVERDYYNKPWFPNGSPWDNEYNDAVWFVVYGDKQYTTTEIYRKCLNTSDVDAIVKFYKGSELTNFEDILVKEAGCIFPANASGKTPIMLLQGDGSLRHHEYDDYYISATVAMPVASGMSYGSQDIGIAYLEHYGFLWMKQRFSYWTASFDRNKFWFRTDVTARY